MRTSIRFVRKVHFPTTFRLTAKRFPRHSPPLRARASAPALSDPAPVPPAEPPAPRPPITAAEAHWLHSLRPWAASLVRRFALGEADLDELLQEVFLLASARWATFLPPPDVPLEVARRSWVAAILWRLTGKLLARLARERRDTRLDVERAAVSVAVDSHESAVLTRDQLHALRRATTPERWRVTVAHWLVGDSVEEIARREGRPTGTIYNLLRLARRDFAAARGRELAASRGPVVSRRKR